ncbi:hypothetical protein G6F42_029106 [Rhizopus arrhizus]|nr:hypothetical protein G6F42_029106 [Rhizopus arrhizus]
MLDSEVVLQAFVVILEEGEHHVVFEDEDQDNVQLSNLSHATAEQYIQHHVKKLNGRFPGESLIHLGESICDASSSYLISE